MDKQDNTAGGVGFWLLSESLSDGGQVLEVGKTISARQSLGFGLASNKIINMGGWAPKNRAMKGVERPRTKIWGNCPARLHAGDL